MIIPAPYWLSYPEMVRLAGGEPVIVQTTEENGWKMTADEFQDAMTPRTKMVIINCPGNPTGAVYTEDELQAIGDVALGEDILILSDEIYEKLVYDDVKHVSIASLSKELYDLTITVNGFSKSYAMTGWRLGYLGAPEQIAKAIDAIQSHSTSGCTSFAQKGALAALKGDQQPRRRHARRSSTCAANTWWTGSQKINRVTVVAPQGAFYVLANISQFGTELDELRRPPAQPSITWPWSRASPSATTAPSASATRPASTSSRRVSTGSRNSAASCSPRQSQHFKRRQS